MNAIKRNSLMIIKSQFCMKKIFYHLQHIKLLEIIRYNKKLQNMLYIKKYNYQKEY